MQGKDVNVKVIRSVWRRTKKGYIKVRDLQPEKDVKGGGGVAGIMRTLSSIAEAPLHIPDNSPPSPCEHPRTRWPDKLRAARDGVIRKLFEIPGEPERKAHAERIARAQLAFLRWLKRHK